MTKKDVQGLKKYRHIVADMVDTSIGYFTPLMALYALKAHQEKTDFCCEWYMDMVMKRHHGMSYKSIPEGAYREVNHDVIKNSFQRRHVARKRYQVCLAIVDRNINGNESIGASWF